LVQLKEEGDAFGVALVAFLATAGVHRLVLCSLVQHGFRCVFYSCIGNRYAG
jgi:hypothetical protein